VDRVFSIKNLSPYSVSVTKRKSIQGGSRDDMVYGRGVGANKPGDARHGKTSGIGVQEEKGRQPGQPGADENEELR
jgi:hypothetical protein